MKSENNQIKNIIFMGEKPLGFNCLKYLSELNNVNIIGICTREKSNNLWWGKQLEIEFAEKNNIPLLKRKDILKMNNIDIIISVLYSFIIEPEIIKQAKLCAVNLHQAPLPEYRGCNSVSHAIINNEKKYGCTLHIIDEELDAGDIIDKVIFDIPENITAKELYDLTDKWCFDVFKKNINSIINNDFKTYPQDFSLNSNIYKRDSLKNKQVNIDNINFEYLYNFVRGNEFYPFEPAYIEQNGKKIYLLTKPFNFNNNLK
jgi:methionyl-tRNA formyltransferase